MNSGIYKIENKINGKLYVGSTVNFTRRWWKHRALLRHGKHPNSHLQASWDKYGEDAFSFSIVEQCLNDSLLSREQFYIDKLRPAYNQTMIAGKIEMTPERRRRLSDATNRAYKEGRLKKTVKAVHQYDLKGNYLNSYPSLTEASVKTHTDLPHLSSALHGKINVAGGFVWRFYKTDKIDIWFNKRGRKLTKEPYRLKNISIVVDSNNEHLIFKNAKDVSLALGCTTMQVYNAIRRNSLLLKKYKVTRKKL